MAKKIKKNKSVITCYPVAKDKKDKQQVVFPSHFIMYGHE